MRTLIVLAVVGLSSAFIPETPEVAAAKARFFQAYRTAQANAKPEFQPTHHVAHQAYHVVPHVAHQVHHQAVHHIQPVHHVQPATYTAKWTGPVAATVPAGVNGAVTPVGDTADVNAARAAFFNAYKAQVAATVKTAPNYPTAVTTTQWQPAAVPQWNAVPTHNLIPVMPVQPRWTGPMAATVPAGLPGAGSQVADTPEVQAAKAAFFQSFQRQAAAAAAPGHIYG